MEISYQVRFTKEDGNSSAIPAGTLEGGIPLLSTHPELRATLGALFSVKACILIITLIGCLSAGSSVKSCVHLEQSTDY
ncbi:hypothetical protein [Dorea formicigenerans]|uniref:hypothetical protein n=1 Tax=Dorea formicigenerans TaxID=39486 RepID=UPI001FA91A03|nr:hypothetical protein [Dorea formicigenerans]